MPCYSIIVNIHLPDQLIFQALLFWVLSYLLEAQLPSNYIDVTDSVVSAICQCFVDRIGRSLRFCQIEFDKEVISDNFMAHSRVFL